MIIAFDAKRVFHNRRGLGNYSRNTIRLLSTYYPEHNYYLFNPSLTEIPDFQLRDNTHEILPESRFGKSFPSVWRSWGMCRQIKSVKPDIYHGLSQELPIGIDRTNVKSVVTMHDAIFMRYPNLYPASYRAIFIQKNRYACRTADRIITISEQTKRDIMNYFHADEQKITVAYQGCNDLFRQPTFSETKNTIREKYRLPAQFLLNVGTIEPRKNLTLILEAMHRYRLDIPLVIIGKSTPYIKELQSLIHKYGLEKQVQFIHDAQTIDLPAIYSMAKVFVYPSIFEGFGIPILEALCTGTPVVSSTGSCFEETGGAYSRYVNPNDADELGSILSQLLSDEASLEKMKTEGLIYADKFTDEKIADQLMHLYLSLK
jgi:glycosyltransferase involved in cell wall biosynthesis